MAVPSADEDPPNAGVRREPERPDHEAITPEAPRPVREFDNLSDEPDNDVEAVKARVLQGRFGGLACQASLDQGDGMAL